MNPPELKKLDAHCLSEFKELLRVFSDVFQTPPEEVADDNHLNKLLARTDFICIAVIADNKVAGGLTAYEMPSYQGNYSEVYLYDIAVKQEYQRKGFGNLLIRSLKDYCKTHNIKTIFVEAHEEDTDAVNFYHTTKASAEKVIHFNYYL